MAVLQSAEDNRIVVSGKLPTTNVDTDVIAQFISQYTGATTTLQLTSIDLGRWLEITIPAAQVPTDDGSYDLSIFGTISGSTTWADVMTTWMAASQEWVEAGGVLRSTLISRQLAIIEGRQDFTTKDYISMVEGFSPSEYSSEIQGISTDQYTSEVEDLNSKEYISDEEDLSSSEYKSEQENLRTAIPR